MQLVITVELPEGAGPMDSERLLGGLSSAGRVPVLIADLESWLRRHGLDIAGWEVVPDVAGDEELGPAVAE